MRNRLNRKRKELDYKEVSADDSSKAGKSKRSAKSKKNNNTPAGLQPLAKKLSGYSIKSRFDTGIQLLQESVSKGAYDLAFQHAFNMYEILEKEPSHTVPLLQELYLILNKGKETIGQQFYAWLLYVFAWAIQKNDWPIEDENPVEKVVALYTESARLGCHGSRLNLANLEAERQYLETAFNHYMLYIKESDTPQLAYDQIGAFYELGWDDHKPDSVEAMRYYRLGHDAGIGSCSCNLARMMTNSINLTKMKIAKVFELYRQAGKRGFADGWYNLGVLYLQGWHCQINLTRSEQYFRKACELDDQDKANLTAVGEVILKNVAILTPERAMEAVGFLDQAIQLRSHEACYLKALLYKDGNKFIARDPVVATKTFEHMLILNESHEYTYTFGMVHLAELYLECGDDLNDMLNRAIDTLSEVERLCIKWQQDNNVIHPAIELIIPTLIRARTERAGIALNMCKGDRYTILEKRSLLWKASEDYKLVIRYSGEYVSEAQLTKYADVLHLLTKVVVAISKDPLLVHQVENNNLMLTLVKTCLEEADALVRNYASVQHQEQTTSHLQRFSVLTTKTVQQPEHERAELSSIFQRYK